MEQEQAGADVIRPFISRRYPMYQGDPGFENWLYQKAGTDERKLDEYLELLGNYGYIAGDGTLYGGYNSIPEPAQVQADIEQRLSSLSPDALSLLRRASVEGERFSTAVLAALDGDQGNIDGRLQEAVNAGVIARDGNTAEIAALGHRYRFVPLQMREILYQDLSDAERADAHTALVEYLGEELGRTTEVGAQDMLSRLISEHNKRVTRPDPPVPPDPKQ